MSPTTLDDAGGEAKEPLSGAKARLGFLPNMYTYMANFPGVLASYLSTYEAFRETTGFTPAEQETVLQRFKVDSPPTAATTAMPIEYPRARARTPRRRGFFQWFVIIPLAGKTGIHSRDHFDQPRRQRQTLVATLLSEC